MALPDLDPLEAPVLARLDALGIAFTRHTHPPVATVEAAVTHWAGIDAMHFKNLLLRNQKGDRHYLVVVEHEHHSAPEDVVPLKLPNKICSPLLFTD